MEIHDKPRAFSQADRQKEHDLFLKKHVGLIHCENKLTLMQRKICNIFLFNALDKINDQDIYEISLRKLCSLIGYHSNDSKLVKDAIKSLISVVMEWNLLEDHTAEHPEHMITWNASALLAGATIRKGTISYSYSPQMRSVLASLDIYGRINLFVQAKFNSTYSLVLYENCVRFKNLQQTAWFPLELFRTLMGVTVDKYPDFKEFKRNVINVAVNEINQKADIYIEPQYRKNGRTITAIQFLLSENEKYKPTFKKLKKEPALSVISDHKVPLMTTLQQDFYLSASQAQELLANYEQEYLSAKISLVKAKKNIDHPGAYLIAALKNDYQHKNSTPAKSTDKENTYQRQAQAATEIISLKNKYSAYKINKYIEFLKAQPEALQQAIDAQFIAEIQGQSEIANMYRKRGPASPFVMLNFISFIDQYYPEIVGAYMNFDDYITSDE